jgi:serine/threonine protein kinase
MLEQLAGDETLLGREIAGYRITGVMGGGGMSIVYRGQRVDAEDDDHAEYAIKVLREVPGISGSHATFRARFYREAETAASLRHHHILPVLDYGEYQGLPYMVMPLATGGTLSSCIASEPGQLPLSDVATYAVQLASALDCAHQSGIVHRDVKPSNTLLDDQGRLLLADFGIARLYEQPYNQEEEATTLTSNGEVLGTPNYMAPEQFQGQHVGPAVDIYAFGVVLYLLVTGRLPFAGETPLALGMAHLYDTPLSPRLLRPDLPVPAAAAILGALAKDPTRRFESAGALADAFVTGVEGRWTEENRTRAYALERESTQPSSDGADRKSSGTAAEQSIFSPRTALVTIAALLLLGCGIATTQAAQTGVFHSAATSQSVITDVSAQERVSATAIRANALASLIHHSGAQVYALWPDGSRRWTTGLDSPLVGTPVVRGDFIYAATAWGTKYVLLASDGTIISRVPAPVPSGNNSRQGNDHHGNGDGHGHGGGQGSSGDSQGD